MKILYFINTLYAKGGIARIVVDKVNYLADHYGHDVTVCTLDNCTDSLFPLSAKVKVMALGGEANVQEGVRGKVWRLLVMPRLVSQAVRRVGNVDLVVNAQTQLVTWVLPFVCRHIPKVMEIHFAREGMRYNIRRKGKVFGWLYWAVAERIYSKYNKFVILTEEDRPSWNLDNIAVINNFTNCSVDCEYMERENTVLCVARYHEQKRLDLLIEAWHLISHKYPDWKVEIYGTGDDKAMLQQKVDRLDMHESFILNDAVDDVVPIYAKSKIFALSSVHEGFALVILEAMAASLPVCAFDVVGVKGIVEDQKTGLLCDFSDVEKLAENLSRLMIDESLRQRLGENGHKKLSQYGVAETMAKWQRLFESIIY